MNPAVLGSFAAAATVPLVLTLLGRIPFFRLPTAPPGFPSRNELKKRYAKYQLAATLWALLSAAALTVGYYLLFGVLARRAHQGLSPGTFLLFPPAAFWALPALFLAIVSAAVPVSYLFRMILGDTGYAEFTRYGDLRYNLNSKRATVAMAVLFGSIVLAILPFALHYHARFSETDLTETPFFSFKERTHPYRDITAIRRVNSFKAPNGKVMRQPFYEILFGDGFVWSTSKSLHDLNLRDQQRLIDFVASRSGKRVELVDPYPRW
jgi:hypothetical protein